MNIQDERNQLLTTNLWLNLVGFCCPELYASPLHFGLDFVINHQCSFHCEIISIIGTDLIIVFLQTLEDNFLPDTLLT